MRRLSWSIDVMIASTSSPFLRIFFFFQAEDGIRDVAVTGVQTCALPICSWTGALLPRKKGLRSRKNQAGQGDEVDGGGRRPRYSFGRVPSLCIPGGSPARGNDARDDPRRSVSSCRASSAETDAGDRRQSLRQRSVARAAGTARNRTDRAASLQPQETGDARWPSAAAVPASLDRRTHQRLARKLPPLGGALRPLAHDISRVLSYRLLHDRLTEGCAIASTQIERSRQL